MERRAIAVRGTVQGVGFRPFVFGLASRLELNGFVRNNAGGVAIEIEGPAGRVEQFLDALATDAPPLASVEQVSWEPRRPSGEHGFRIDASERSFTDEIAPIFISPDVATCDKCLAELFDPTNRRFQYPFINCTNCGPRLTIVTGAPYDRQRTTMANFAMCPDCQREYDEPADRRFHAQPTCCPHCGPRLALLDRGGEKIDSAEERTESIVDSCAAALLNGKIVAIKGLGGFHLCCDARNEAAVAELRRRKHREDKPFAVMAGDLAAAAALCDIEEAEAKLLQSWRRPIVLLRPRQHLAAAVAPGNPHLGVMLPYTPLHHLLMRAVGNGVLVMTSGNQSDEPIAYDNDEAVERLGGIADLFLVHDRPIHVRCDDSVTRVVAGAELPIRRSRGYAPRPITLPKPCDKPTLAVGGQLKGTFALGRGGHAFMSHHLGDLDHFEAYRAFERDVPLFEQLFEMQPERIVCDLHPDYASSRYARQRAQRDGIQLLAVQHHHAHMASCMAENGWKDGAVIGVSFDGTGYGTDGTIWGGEFLVGDYRDFRRAAQLRSVALPGGEAAIREPWRMGIAHLVDAGCDVSPLLSRLGRSQIAAVRRMILRKFNAPMTSSAGRLFDAVAWLVGLRDRVTYEGQAAIELEWLASGDTTLGSYPFEVVEEQSVLVIDTRPIVVSVAADLQRNVARAAVARKFHSTVVEMISSVCGKLRRGNAGHGCVALSGGVFMNSVLTCETVARLEGDGFHVLRHRLVPPNDGGLSLGQLAVAAARASLD